MQRKMVEQEERNLNNLRRLVMKYSKEKKNYITYKVTIKENL